MAKDLLRSLEPMVRDGVIDGPTAERIRTWARGNAGITGSRRATLVLGVLGTALLLLGLILLLAHNWEELGRPVRLFISLLPLLGAQAFAFVTLRGKADRPAWREAAAVAVTLTAGLSVALVSQTYHVPGSFERFLAVWIAMALPVIFILRSDTAALLGLAGLLTLGLVEKESRATVTPFLFLFPVFLALFIQRIREAGPVTRRVYTWAIALTLPWFLIIPTGHAGENFLFPAYGCLVALYAMAGFDTGRFGSGILENPFRLLAIPSIMVWLAIGSVPDMAKEFARMDVPALSKESWPGAAAPVAVILLSWVGLGWMLWKRRGAEALWAAFGPFMSILWFLGIARVDRDLTRGFTLVGYNLFLLGLGITLLVSSIRRSSLLLLNGGVLLLVTQGLIWIFQGEVPFTVRGLGFMAAGALLLGLNLWMARRRKKAEGLAASEGGPGTTPLATATLGSRSAPPAPGTRRPGGSK